MQTLRRIRVFHRLGLLFAVTGLLLCGAVFVFHGAAWADATASKEIVCESIGTGSDCAATPSGTDVNDTIRTVINILTSLIGVVGVIMIAVAGYKYITSSGDSGKVGSAKSTLIYALIGLAVAALAQLIARFVLEKSVN